MKDIKIYVASADDLRDENLELPELLERINRVFNRRKINFELIKHADEMGEIGDCELCLTLYYTKFGDYDQKEFELAYESLKKGENPQKIYVFFKNSENLEDIISKDLLEFKNNFSVKYGHFFCKFENTDTMKLELLMQLQMYNSNAFERLFKVENQKIKIDNEVFVDLAQIPFAKLNTDYIALTKDLEKLNKRIARLQAHEDELDEIDREDLQDFLDERIEKKEKFAQLQEALLNTALRIAKTYGQKITERMERAIEAFQSGDVRKANNILDEAERDGEMNFNDFMATQELANQKKENVILSIKEVQLKIETMSADMSIEVESRKTQVIALHEQIIHWAKGINYDTVDLALLIFGYATLLYGYGDYDTSLSRYEELLSIASMEKDTLDEDVFVTIHIFIAYIYFTKGELAYSLEYLEKNGNTFHDTETKQDPFIVSMKLGLVAAVQTFLGNYQKALGAYEELLAFTLETQDEEDVSVHTIQAYMGIGSIYKMNADYATALEYSKKGLDLTQKMGDEDDFFTASVYVAVSEVYRQQEDYKNALDYMQKALAITKKELGIHLHTAMAFDRLGCIYLAVEDYEQAKLNCTKALEICIKTVSENSVFVSTVHMSLGSIAYAEHEYSTALDHFNKSLSLQRQIYEDVHPEIAKNLRNIGNVYEKQDDIFRAVEYYEESFPMLESVFGLEHSSVINNYHEIVELYNKIGVQYIHGDKYPKAEEYLLKSIEFIKKFDDKTNYEYIASCFFLGVVYHRMRNFKLSLEYSEEAIRVKESISKEKDTEIALFYKNTAETLIKLEEFQPALDYYLKALEIEENILGLEDEKTVNTSYNVFRVYNLMGDSYLDSEDFDSAEEYYLKEIQMIESKLGLEHELAGDRMDDLANLYEKTALELFNESMYDTSEKLLMSELALRNRNPKTEPEQIAKVNFLLGVVYSNKKMFSTALKHFLEALPILENSWEMESQYTCLCYRFMGDTYIELDDYDNAFTSLFKALESSKIAFEDDEEQIAIIMGNIAFLYNVTGNYTKALEYRFSALEIREKILGTEHEDTMFINYKIAEVYENMENFKKAQEYYTKVYALRNTTLGADHADTIECREKLDLVQKKLQ